jgi:hypothetical protein
MGTNSNKITAIYTELDVLLDTRLGTLARMNQAVAAQVLSSGDYLKRTSDRFLGVDQEEFKKLYAARDTVTLAHSSVTQAIEWLGHLVGVLADQAIERPYHDGSKIVVNIYPYQLTGEEQEQVVKAIAAWMSKQVPVELISVRTQDLTPLHCKSSYAMMMVYDYDVWLESHAKEFEQTRLPEVTLFAPALYFNQVPTVKELEKAVREAGHPMQALELLASPLIDLKLIDVRFFSILPKK